MRFRAILYVSAAAAVVYLFSAGWPVGIRAGLKGVPVGALVVVAVASRHVRRDALVLGLGLAFSTAGDVLLDLDPGLFVFGLGAFLLAHVTYISLFVRNRAPGVRLDPGRLAAVVAVVAASATLSAWIVPSVGELAVPVVVYIFAITAMVVAAILARFSRWWVAAGAVLFLISDSLLAINRFKTPVPLRDVLVWSTYYLGQCGIAVGYLESGR